MLINGNALHIPLADQSIQCCVTSPPYWGLRDYGVGGQLGLEQTPEEYVENMVNVFREVKRVLRDDGTLWLNLGDSYAGNPGNGRGGGRWFDGGMPTLQGMDKKPAGLKPKDLVGIPWRVAFALQADGWYLRNDIIWHKPNPMPESVTDRCTKSHEYIFLLTKNAKYYYDNEAVKEPHTTTGKPRNKNKENRNDCLPVGDRFSEGERLWYGNTGRNKRTVWTVTTKPYSGAHYATFPPDLIDDCIKAGTSEKGKCPECGTPWERVTETKGSTYNKRKDSGVEVVVYTTGWQPGCKCGHDPIPCIVLDPFVGSGTTCLVARDLGRESVGFDLNLDYLVNNARVRLELDKLEYWCDRGPEVKGNFEGLPMFTD